VDSIYREIAGFSARGEPFAFAVLIETKGSTPQKSGAKALFLPDGRVIGTLGGGCLEADTRQKALRAIETGQCAVYHAVLDDDFGWDDGLICGGAVRTFVQPNPRSDAVWQAVLAGAPTRQRRMLATLLPSGQRALFAGGTLVAADNIPTVVLGWLAETSALLLREGEPQPTTIPHPPSIHCSDPSTVGAYYEPLLPNPVLIVCGAGHVGAALGRLAAGCGFDVTVVDERAGFANRARFPDAARIIVEPPDAALRELRIDRDTYVVIVTRGHRHDAQVLREVIHSDAAYIGMIGSRRKVRTIFEGFLAEGVAGADDFRRVRSPMGVPIGAVSVEEIAVSILAELIAARRGQADAPSLSVTGQLADNRADRLLGPASPPRVAR
jgi:xanthine dehydrogenase accessory factor